VGAALANSPNGGLPEFSVEARYGAKTRRKSGEHRGRILQIWYWSGNPQDIFVQTISRFASMIAQRVDLLYFVEV